MSVVEQAALAARELVLDGLPHQMDFWQDMTDGARIALVGGLGTGKTRSLVIKRLILQTANPGLNSMLLEPTYPMTRDILEPALIEILQEEFGIPIRINGTDHDLIWPRALGGGITHLRSADRPDSLAGTNLSDVGIDEPGLIEHLAYTRAAGRARHPKAKVRQVYLAGSPEGLGWFAELFDAPKPPHRTIRARSWHPSIGQYPREIATTYAGSAWQLASYLEGRFVPAFEGRCYGPFDRERHVASVADRAVYEPALDLVLACDFNIDAMRWLVMQFHPGQIVVLDEIALGQDGAVEVAAREFVRRWGRAAEREWHRGPLVVAGDAAGRARTQTGQVCYDELLRVVRPEFRGVSTSVPAANPLQRDRVGTVNHHLSGAGGLTVVIDARCGELIKDLEQNRWVPGAAEIEKKKHPPENQRTHAGDAFGYALWMRAPLARPRLVRTPSEMVRAERPGQFQARDRILGMGT